MNTDYDGRQVVGIDLHRRRSVIVQQSETGERLGVTRIDNDPFALAEQVAGWGEAPQVVLQYGPTRPPTTSPGLSTTHKKSVQQNTTER